MGAMKERSITIGDMRIVATTRPALLLLPLAVALYWLARLLGCDLADT